MEEPVSANMSRPERVSVVVFGDTQLAANCVELLSTQLDGYKCGGLVHAALQPVYCPAATAAHACRVPVHKHVTDPLVLARLVVALNPDIIVLACPSLPVPSAVIQTARIGCCGVHLSLLPLHQGPSPLQWTIIQQDSQAGASWLKLRPGGLPWSGQCLTQAEVPVQPADTPPLLLERLRPAIMEQLPAALIHLEEGTSGVRQQQGATTSLEPALTPKHVLLDWSWKADKVDAMLRGAVPWPGAITTLGGLTVQVDGRANETEEVGTLSTKPGTVLAVSSKGLTVATGTLHCPAVITHLQISQQGARNAKQLAESFCVQRGWVPGVLLGAN